MLKQVPDAAPVSEAFGIPVFFLQDFGQHFPGVLGEGIAAFPAAHVKDPDKLVHRIIRELHEPVETAFKAGVGRNKGLHQLRIAGDNHHQVVAVVFHCLQQGIDGFLAVIRFSFACEGIGLVDKKNAAQGLGDDLLGLDGGLPDVSGHQAGPIHLDQPPLAQHAQALVNPRHQPGNHGFARARIAREHHVQGHIGHRQAFLLPGFHDADPVDQAVDLAFDDFKADVGFQFGLQVLDGLLMLGLLLRLGGRNVRLLAFGGGNVRGTVFPRRRRILGRRFQGRRLDAPQIVGQAFELFSQHILQDIILHADDLIPAVHCDPS